MLKGYEKWLEWREEYFKTEGATMGRDKAKPKREKKKPKTKKKKKKKGE